jgi:hypothetical protein
MAGSQTTNIDLFSSFCGVVVVKWIFGRLSGMGVWVVNLSSYSRGVEIGPLPY